MRFPTSNYQKMQKNHKRNAIECVNVSIIDLKPSSIVENMLDKLGEQNIIVEARKKNLHNHIEIPA